MDAVRTRYLAPTIPICTLHWTLTYLGTSMYIGPHTCMSGYVSAYHGVGKLCILLHTILCHAVSFARMLSCRAARSNTINLSTGCTSYVYIVHGEYRDKRCMKPHPCICLPHMHVPLLQAFSTLSWPQIESHLMGSCMVFSSEDILLSFVPNSGA